VLRKNIALGLEPRMVLTDLEQAASTTEGFMHHEGRLIWLRALELLRRARTPSSSARITWMKGQ
jgi:hypothetical protein